MVCAAQWAQSIVCADSGQLMDDQAVATYLTNLNRGEIESAGLLDWGSNYTFLVEICLSADDKHTGNALRAVYKPQRGERPLWDFPAGSLYLREQAAFVVSELLGWRLVPPTIIRGGPYGKGSVQLFINHDPDEHYLTFSGQFVDQLQRIVLFDAVINNADRKSGHVLLDHTDRLWSIDHGICFHSEYKLRSVIWEFAGNDIPEALVADLLKLKSALETDTESAELRTLLSDREMNALLVRTQQLVDQRIFPLPGPGRHYPWPPV